MDTSTGGRPTRRNVACDECKRRKIRCSAEPICSSCARDNKKCVYSSPIHRASALEKTVARYEDLVRSMKRAWEANLPNVSLEDALDRLDGRSPRADSMSVHSDNARGGGSDTASSAAPENIYRAAQPDSGDIEHYNPEVFEFDESQELDGAIDGMGFLTLEPSKSGYTGPQSGIAALQVLRSLPSASPIDEADEFSAGLARNAANRSSLSHVDVNSFVDDYFKYYHPAYPLLHEGSFRARMSGALAKPRDGSWPFLNNMVLAIGAFVGDSQGSNYDLEYFRAAKQAISLSVIEKGSLTYVQGVILMANYLQKRNKPNAGFAFAGIAWSMALAIGLHREFGPYGTTPFAMELRRRTWWTLYNLLSAAQLTLGRPPASLIGINVRFPINVDDSSLAVDMEELPPATDGPTVTSCLIAHIPLARIANEVQDAVLSHQVPVLEFVDRLDRDIESWEANLPPYFNPRQTLKLRFELPKRVLLWRSYHLRIVLNRPFLFQAISRKDPITGPDMRIQRCIATADKCVGSICQFLRSNNEWTRGFAWYATYWLISASFVLAICFAYAPESESADEWQLQLRQTIEALQSLGFAHVMADRARTILQKFHDRFTVPMSTQPPTSDTLPQFIADNFGLSRRAEAMPQANGHEWAQLERQMPAPIGFRNDDADMLWSWQPAPNAEFIDAAGGSLYQEYPEDLSML